MMGTDYRGTPPPAKESKPVYVVLAPRAGETHEVTILDARILGVPCHWVTDAKTRKGRSRACMHEMGHCEYCGNGRDLWLGWIGVIDHGGRCRAVLRVGRESALALARLSVPFAGLRGMRLLITRPADHRTQSLRYEVAPLAAPVPLPESHQIEHTICVVLGCDSLPDYRVTAEDIGRQA